MSKPKKIIGANLIDIISSNAQPCDKLEALKRLFGIYGEKTLEVFFGDLYDYLGTIGVWRTGYSSFAYHNDFGFFMGEKLSKGENFLTKRIGLLQKAGYEVVEAMIDMIRRGQCDADMLTYYAIFGALEKTAGSTLNKELICFLGEEYGGFRTFAAISLGNVGDSSAISPLMSYLDCENDGDRREIVRAIVLIAARNGIQNKVARKLAWLFLKERWKRYGFLYRWQQAYKMSAIMAALGKLKNENLLCHLVHAFDEGDSVFEQILCFLWITLGPIFRSRRDVPMYYFANGSQGPHHLIGSIYNDL